jgi:hypothetical protein
VPERLGDDFDRYAAGNHQRGRSCRFMRRSDSPGPFAKSRFGRRSARPEHVRELHFVRLVDATPRASRVLLGASAGATEARSCVHIRCRKCFRCSQCRIESACAGLLALRQPCDHSVVVSAPKVNRPALRSPPDRKMLSCSVLSFGGVS